MFAVSPKKRLLVLSSYLVIMLLCLSGARCGKPRVAPQYSSGPSSAITPIEGAGTSWAYGDFPWNPASFSGDLLTQINVHRNALGMDSLRWHDGMALSAQLHARDMNSHQQLYLVSNDGVDMFERMVSASPRIDFDYAFGFVGYTQLPSGLLNALLLDPSARAAIEDINVTHFGASFQTAPGPYYVAVLFARNARP